MVISQGLSWSKRRYALPVITDFKKGSYILLYLTLFSLVGYMLMRLGFVVSNGYGSYQSGNFGTKPFVIFIFEQIFWIIVFQKLESNTRANRRRRLLYIIIPVLLLDMFTGKRGTAASQLLVMVLILRQTGYLNLSLRRLLPIGIMFLFLLDYIGEIRHSAEREIRSYELASAGLIFLDEQASSLNTLGYAIEHRDSKEISSFGVMGFFADIFMMIDKLSEKAGIHEQLTLDEKADKFSYSGYILTRAADGSLLREGKSTGTSFITELWLLGGEYMVFFGSLVLCLFMRSFDVSKTDGLAVNLIFIPDIVYLARMSFGSILVLNFLALLLILFNTIRK